MSESQVEAAIVVARIEGMRVRTESGADIGEVLLSENGNLAIRLEGEIAAATASGEVDLQISVCVARMPAAQNTEVSDEAAD